MDSKNVESVDNKVETVVGALVESVDNKVETVVDALVETVVVAYVELVLGAEQLSKFELLTKVGS